MIIMEIIFENRISYWVISLISDYKYNNNFLCYLHSYQISNNFSSLDISCLLFIIYFINFISFQFLVNIYLFNSLFLKTSNQQINQSINNKIPNKINTLMKRMTQHSSYLFFLIWFSFIIQKMSIQWWNFNSYNKISWITNYWKNIKSW